MTQTLHRRQFLQVGSAAAGAALFLPKAMADDENIRFSTYTYKRVGELEIKADVYRPKDDKRRPVVVWIHGGALILGNRAVGGRIKQNVLDAGFALVSIDYRLAPETKLPAIISDVEDAFRWIREKGPELLCRKPTLALCC